MIGGITAGTDEQRQRVAPTSCWTAVLDKEAGMRRRVTSGATRNTIGITAVVMMVKRFRR